MTETSRAAPEPSVSADLAALVARAERAGKGAPPVESWHPDHCGDIDMVIRADGSWTYNGSPIQRPALVRLFSTVLRRDEDGRTYLVTPAEKLGITVEDAHFLAVEMSRDIRDGVPVLTFRTGVGDVVEAGPTHPLRFRIGEDAAFEPYVLVRGRLEAKLTRALAYDLAGLIETDEEGGAFLASGGARFPLPAAAFAADGAHDALSTADLRARLPRLAGAGAGDGAREIGDHVLNPDWAQLAERPAAREAAVLVPVVDDPAGATLILTRRADTLRKHSGQVAFPGGSIDPKDASPEAAALRESREEIGLDSAFVETLGRLPPYRTTTGFRIVPVLAVVSPGFSLAPNPAEVAEVFQVPLAFLMDAANHHRESLVFEGRERFFYSMPFGGQIIWGVTAGIVRALYERLYA